MASFQGAVYQIMQLQKLVNMFGGDLTRRYGQKVHKLTLHGGFSCPNRDGTIGRGGCTFCNVASFADEAQQHRSIAEQLAHQANLVNRAKRYLAYFQKLFQLKQIFVTSGTQQECWLATFLGELFA